MPTKCCLLEKGLFAISRLKARRPLSLSNRHTRRHLPSRIFLCWAKLQQHCSSRATALSLSMLAAFFRPSILCKQTNSIMPFAFPFSKTFDISDISMSSVHKMPPKPSKVPQGPQRVLKGFKWSSGVLKGPQRPQSLHRVLNALKGSLWVLNSL